MNFTKKYTILSIETSCDETAAAVYTTEQGILSSVLHSQTALHVPFGGVVPEVASRSHIEKITPIVTQALSDAHKKLTDIDVFAVTSTPGLAGSLLVGLCFAKALAYAQQKPLVAVNHLEGHIFSAHLEHEIPWCSYNSTHSDSQHQSDNRTTMHEHYFPYLCMAASGGHTALYLVKDFGVYELIGKTVDDAAGEAFDKVAALIGLEYPGGPLIEKLAKNFNFQDAFEYPRMRKKGLDFSFSGLKTAVLYDLIKRGAYDPATKRILKPDDMLLKEQVASSLLVCIGDIFEDRITQAFELYPKVKALTFVGGVACNNYLKERLALLAQKHRKLFFSPAKKYCTDNAAMIAFVGHYKAQRGQFAPLTLEIFE